MEKFEKACKLGKLGHKEACEIVTYKGLCELGHKEACEIVSLKMLCELSDEKACSMAYHKKKALGFKGLGHRHNFPYSFKKILLPESFNLFLVFF